MKMMLHLPNNQLQTVIFMPHAFVDIFFLTAIKANHFNYEETFSSAGVVYFIEATHGYVIL